MRFPVGASRCASVAPPALLPITSILDYFGGVVGGVVSLPVAGDGWPSVVGVVWFPVEWSMCGVIFILSMHAFFISSFDMLLSLAFCLAMQSFIMDCCEAVMDELLIESEGIESAANAWALVQISAANRIGVMARFIEISSLGYLGGPSDGRDGPFSNTDAFRRRWTARYTTPLRRAQSRALGVGQSTRCSPSMFLTHAI
jgi:hypothetical protein